MIFKIKIYKKLKNMVKKYNLRLIDETYTIFIRIS